MPGKAEKDISPVFSYSTFRKVVGVPVPGLRFVLAFGAFLIVHRESLCPSRD